ncbi:MAG: alpha/beta hydrolase [Chloroflexi bacterium]|nr:alpha/beta hydrolase [Chloroflexota bacterium]
MKPLLLILLLWATVLPVAAQSQVARFVNEVCPESLSRLAGSGMRCGRLHVPEDRYSKASAEISVFVVQLPARVKGDSRPIIVLAGGPGDAASAETAWWLNTRLRDKHDIILVDQRGAGRSRPSLNCPEFDASDDEDSLAECRDRLLAEGIKLTAYGPESIARDIADLIKALELGPANVYAHSYGARVARLLAQMRPQQIRAMLLDSAYTGEASALASAAPNVMRSMQRLYADCQANDACLAAYPDLATQFSRAAAALGARPVEVDGISPDSALRLDSESFVILLRDMLADAERLPYIPALIAAIAEGDDDLLDSVASDVMSPAQASADAHSEGLYFSALCVDEIARTSRAEIKAEAAALPPAYQPLAASAQDLLLDCLNWIDAGTGLSREPPRREIPTLHLLGAYDPIAPVAALNGPLVWRQAFPRLGHGVLEYEPCAEALAVAFFANPTAAPVEDCFKDLRPPAFFIRRDS